MTSSGLFALGLTIERVIVCGGQMAQLRRKMTSSGLFAAEPQETKDPQN